MSSEPRILPASAAVDLGTDHVHTLLVPGVRFVNLRLLDFMEQPLPDVFGELTVGGRADPRRSDAEAKVSFRVSVAFADAQGLLVVDSTELGYRRPLPVQLGELPPVEEPTGQRTRLDNLGYVPVDNPDEPEPTRWAIEEFQCEHGLSVDGDCGPKTQAKLVEVHGH
ncbi:MAG: peptidoglycan-binding protein [Deltaproteobacteria bacterium]|nr:peptidoglycan-binding protein [Deltaproteobacteria bacterium]